MTKMNFAFVALIALSASSAYAAAGKAFHTLDGVEKGCKVAKFAGGKWVQTDENSLNGKDVSNVTPSKANAEFSNFKLDGAWYAAKTDCLKDSDTAADVPAAPGSMPKYFVEIKGELPILMGSNHAATSTTYTTTSPASTDKTDAYKAGVGVDGRAGYFWKGNKYFILDVAGFSGSQNETYTGFLNGTSKVSDSILTVDVGIQMPFAKPLFGMKPYVAGMLGYAKLTGTDTGTINSIPLTVSYSGSGLNVKVEGGLVKDFTTHLSALASLGFNYVSVSPKYDVSNLQSIYPQGGSVASRGYSNFALSLGLRYSL